jgi:epoxyqueuosine reductase
VNPSPIPPDALSATLAQLAANIRTWGLELGFQQIGITDLGIADDEARLMDWLAQGRHGEMQYMERYGRKRARPDEIVPGTIRVISARMNYVTPEARPTEEVLGDKTTAFISRYALGRDYHKLMRRRLSVLAERIQAHIDLELGDQGERSSYRVFVDSGPVLEKAFAQRAGLGWIGKHTNLLHHRAGSWFFLGEILTNLPLPIDEPATNHCGTCHACIDVCPTQAIVAPYELDATRCISYLTIESHSAIPIEFREAIGNRIYGCDDCQLVCPWNKFARESVEPDFKVRHGLDSASLVSLFAWSEEQFLARTEGSAIRRIGHVAWLRNIAVALGNAPASVDVLEALRSREHHESPLVREHVRWALEQHAARKAMPPQAPRIASKHAD